jgi:hypothetical protein
MLHIPLNFAIKIVYIEYICFISIHACYITCTFTYLFLRMITVYVLLYCFYVLLYFVLIIVFFPCFSTAQFWALAASIKLFRFISVTTSRTVSSTPWTGYQLVVRPLLSVPGDCEDGDEVGGMNCFGRGNRSTRRKPAPTSLCPPQIPFARPGREPGPPRWETSD